MTVYKHHELDISRVKTLARSPINGMLYASYHRWKNPIAALHSATILDDPPRYDLVLDHHTSELKQIFGDIPEYPGEYLEKGS